MFEPGDLVRTNDKYPMKSSVKDLPGMRGVYVESYGKQFAKIARDGKEYLLYLEELEEDD